MPAPHIGFEHPQGTRPSAASAHIHDEATGKVIASCGEIKEWWGGAYIAVYVCVPLPPQVSCADAGREDRSILAKDHLPLNPGCARSQGDGSGRIHKQQCMRHPRLSSRSVAFRCRNGDEPQTSIKGPGRPLFRPLPQMLS